VAVNPNLKIPALLETLRGQPLCLFGRGPE
jgi:hypothetical protein